MSVSILKTLTWYLFIFTNKHVYSTESVNARRRSETDGDRAARVVMTTDDAIRSTANTVCHGHVHRLSVHIIPVNT